MDNNSDGKITLDEMPEQMRQRFDRIDQNGDGEIDEAEIEAMSNRDRGQPRGRGQSPGRGGQERI